MDISSIVAVLIVCCGLYYLTVQVGLIVGLFFLPKPTTAIRSFVSVIVAARNEERTIGRLLESLSRQSYTDYEVIIVDDRSEDATAQIVHTYQESNTKVRLVSIKSVSDRLPPKKNALTEGIRESKGEILCFTDADCDPPSTWIETLLSYFESDVGVVAGYSPYVANLHAHTQRLDLWSRALSEFIAGEEFKGAIWSAGGIGMNLAWLCTGRNLAYRRKVFEEVGGFEQIKKSISGDDDLFIQLVRRTTRWKIRYARSHEGFVPTQPPATFEEFVAQRTRHFSVGKFFTFPMKMFFFVFHGSNLLIFLLAIGFIFSRSLFQYGIIVFALKLAVDLLLTLVGVQILSQGTVTRRMRPGNFVLTEILYIVYNTFIGPLGFLRSFEWKPAKKT